MEQNGTPIPDLDTANSIDIIMQHDSLIYTLPCTVTDVSTGTVSFELSATETAASGDFYAQFKVVWSDKTIFVPDPGYLLFRIQEAAGNTPIDDLSTLFMFYTPYTVGPAGDISVAAFNLFVTRFTEKASGDGLSGNDLEQGISYLIADTIESKEDNSGFISEKIGEYSYKKASHVDDGISLWMQKYNNLLASQMVSAPSSGATRADKDMSALGIDQNSIYGV